MLMRETEGSPDLIRGKKKEAVQSEKEKGSEIHLFETVLLISRQKKR